jgi:hypothetical protein
MKIVRKCCVFVLFCCGCYAQIAQPLATTDELPFFRFMLTNLASLDHSPKAIEAYEASLVKQFGLNAQESATIHASAQTLKALLTQLRQSSQAIVNGKKNPAASDATALSALADQRDQLINTLANEILNAVRPETAARLRAPGQVVAASATQGQAGK